MSEMTQTPVPAETGKAGGIRWGTVLLWASLLTLLALLGWALIRTNATRPEAGQPAPDFDIEFFDGYTWQDMPAANLSDMRGNVVVLNFWAAWCVECRLEAELIENAWRQYQNDDVIFLGVAYADVEPNSIAYMKEFGISYPNGPDLGTDISDSYEITGVPETFFIGKDGVIGHVQIGPLNETMLNGVIQRLLQEGG